MNRYEIRCTEEQTRKALELGAPINLDYHYDDFDNSVKIRKSCYAEIPTAEQMIGWLEEKRLHIDILSISNKNAAYFIHHINTLDVYDFISNKTNCDSRKEATLAAIDAALEYMSSK